VSARERERAPRGRGRGRDEAVRKYPSLYDKSKKEYKEGVTTNAWKEVADQLDLIDNREFFKFLTFHLKK